MHHEKPCPDCKTPWQYYVDAAACWTLAATLVALVIALAYGANQ